MRTLLGIISPDSAVADVVDNVEDCECDMAGTLDWKNVEKVTSCDEKPLTKGMAWRKSQVCAL